MEQSSDRGIRFLKLEREKRREAGPEFPLDTPSHLKALSLATSPRTLLESGSRTLHDTLPSQDLHHSL